MSTYRLIIFLLLSVSLTSCSTSKLASPKETLSGVQSTQSSLGTSRTKEELMGVFDTQRGAVYAIFNRELKTNPTLKGKLVVQMLIEPSGMVTECHLTSSDFSETINREVVSLVKQFRFGAKEVAPLTLTWPIEFLPS